MSTPSRSNLVKSNLVLASAALLLAAAFVPGSTATAGSGQDQVRLKFGYSRADSAERTYSRLKLAAERACWSDTRIPMSREQNACADRLVDAAIKRIADPGLSALHDQRSGRPTGDYAALASR